MAGQRCEISEVGNKRKEAGFNGERYVTHTEVSELLQVRPLVYVYHHVAVSYGQTLQVGEVITEAQVLHDALLQNQ